MSNKIDRCNKAPTLCWCCENATSNYCPWVEKGDPVPGWRATPTKIKQNGRVVCDSYHVNSCPMFKRDATNGGRMKYVSHLEYVPEKPLKGETDENSNHNKRGGSASGSRVAESDGTRHVDSGRRDVANKASRRSWGAMNHVERDPFDLALAIIERHALDRRALDCGERDFVLVDGVLVSKEDTLTFFFEPWFEDLCVAIHYTPKQVRKALRVPEDGIERLLREVYGEEAVSDRARNA